MFLMPNPSPRIVTITLSVALIFNANGSMATLPSQHASANTALIAEQALAAPASGARFSKTFNVLTTLIVLGIITAVAGHVVDRIIIHAFESQARLGAKDF